MIITIAMLLCLLLDQGCRNLSPFPLTTPLTAIGITSSRAQVVSWLNTDTFLVSRWDGTLTIFQALKLMNGAPPLLVDVLMLPSAQPAEMAFPLSSHMFVTSNDQGSLALWEKSNLHYILKEIVYYDPTYGTANSATVVETNGISWLITGHSQGMVVIWKITTDAISEATAISIKSPNPALAPYPTIWNVRSLVTWANGIVISGSEDGDLTMIHVPDGTLLARTRYHPIAHAGINSLAVWNDYLVVAGSPIRETGQNLFLYRIHLNDFTLADSINLIKETKLPKAFTFSVQLAHINDRLYFFASTEEGLLWTGTIVSDKFHILGTTKVACEWGAAMAFQQNRQLLSVAADDIRLYSIAQH